MSKIEVAGQIKYLKKNRHCPNYLKGFTSKKCNVSIFCTKFVKNILIISEKCTYKTFFFHREINIYTMFLSVNLFEILSVINTKFRKLV